MRGRRRSPAAQPAARNRRRPGREAPAAIDRRGFLRRGAALALLAGMAPLRRATADCTVFPSQTEGPFFFDAGLLRSDITEQRPGVDLRIELQIVDRSTCAPIPNAVVQIWHTDREGLYSGYLGQGDDGTVDTRGQTFMRGLQVTDADGRIAVDTIYPGWYPGRVPHVHFKVFLDDRSAATSQLYFPDAVSNAVYETEFYADRGRSPVTLATDILLRTTPLEAVLMDVAEREGSWLAMREVGIAVPAGFTPLPTATLTPRPPTPTLGPPTGDCIGDCDADGAVSVAELVRGVNIALGRAPIEECPAFDRTGRRTVTISELVAAVNSALRGCA